MHDEETRDTVHLTLEEQRALQAAFADRNEVTKRIALLNPIIKDAETGGDICFYRCGYGTLTAREDEAHRFTHREGCLWLRARQRVRWREGTKHWLQRWREANPDLYS